MEKELEDLKQILDEDEEVKFSAKPNKMRYVFINIIAGLASIFLFGGLFIILGTLGLINIIRFVNESTGQIDYSGPIGMVVMGSVIIIISIFTFVIPSIVRYGRSLYVVTNKRVIIRSGFIGVDYKSLDIRDIITINVRVDFLDKLVSPNTGTILFGSAASPLVQNGNRQTSSYSFLCIDHPYEAYKTIKSLTSK